MSMATLIAELDDLRVGARQQGLAEADKWLGKQLARLMSVESGKPDVLPIHANYSCTSVVREGDYIEVCLRQAAQHHTSTLRMYLPKRYASEFTVAKGYGVVVQDQMSESLRTE